MVAGFPFVTPSDKANYVGALLTPSLRLLLPAPYLLVGIGAPMMGSGKSFLAEILRILHGGVFRAEFPREEAEVNKSILAILRDTTGAVVVHDNVTGVLRSPTLAGLLTSDRYSSRLLGVNENPEYRNDRLWVITGNSLAYGGDISRRNIEITIDPKTPKPWERTDFAITDIQGWAKAHRGELLAALLTLTRAWVVAGKPVKAKSRGDQYAGYVQGIRGVLDFAEIDGLFDDDAATKSEPGGSDDAEWAVYLKALRAHFGTEIFTSAEVVRLLDVWQAGVPRLDPACLPAELAEKWDNCRNGSRVGFTRTLGFWMAYRNGRWAGELNARRRPFSRGHDERHWKVEAIGDDLSE